MHSGGPNAELDLNLRVSTATEHAFAGLKARALVKLALAVFITNLFASLLLGAYYLTESYALAESSIHEAANDRIARADDLMRRAHENANNAVAHLDDPITRLLIGAVPPVDNERQVLLAAAEAAQTLEAEANDFLREVGDISQPRRLGETLYSDGAFDTRQLARLREPISALGETMDDAHQILSESPLSRLSPIEDRITKALDTLASRREDLRQATALLDAVPDLLGANTPHTYVIAFQSPSEARGGGGLIGVYGLLSVNDGALRLGSVTTIRDLLPPLERGVAAPGWYRDMYGKLGGTTDPRSANLTPTFPAAARILSAIIERRTDRDVDGVISMDPLVLGALTNATGPISAKGWDVEINERNVRRVLLEDVYQHFHGKEHLQNAYFRDLVHGVWSTISEGSVDSFKLVQALGSSVSRQRLKVFSDTPETQNLLSVAGLAGRPSAYGRNVHMVFHNNFAANKIDFYLRRHISVSVRVVSEQAAYVDTTIALSNELTDLSNPTVLIRPGVDRTVPLGTNHMTLHTLLPKDALNPQMARNGRPLDAFIAIDDGFPMLWDVVKLGPGASTEVKVSYELPIANGLRMILVPQATVRPDLLSLSISAPADLCLELQDKQTQEWEWSGFLREPREIEAKIRSSSCN